MAFCLFIEIKFKSGINGQEPYPGRPTIIEYWKRREELLKQE
jgi:hypothetical protein